MNRTPLTHYHDSCYDVVLYWPHERPRIVANPPFQPKPGQWTEALCPVLGCLPGGAFLNTVEWNDIKDLGQ